MRNSLFSSVCLTCLAVGVLAIDPAYASSTPEEKAQPTAPRSGFEVDPTTLAVTAQANDLPVTVHGLSLGLVRAYRSDSTLGLDQASAFISQTGYAGGWRVDLPSLAISEFDAQLQLGFGRGMTAFKRTVSTVPDSAYTCGAVVNGRSECSQSGTALYTAPNLSQLVFTYTSTDTVQQVGQEEAEIVQTRVAITSTPTVTTGDGETYSVASSNSEHLSSILGMNFPYLTMNWSTRLNPNNTPVVLYQPGTAEQRCENEVIAPMSDSDCGMSAGWVRFASFGGLSMYRRYRSDSTGRYSDYWLDADSDTVLDANEPVVSYAWVVTGKVTYVPENVDPVPTGTGNGGETWDPATYVSAPYYEISRVSHSQGGVPGIDATAGIAATVAKYAYYPTTDTIAPGRLKSVTAATGAQKVISYQLVNDYSVLDNSRTLSYAVPQDGNGVAVPKVKQTYWSDTPSAATTYSLFTLSAETATAYSQYLATATAQSQVSFDAMRFGNAWNMMGHQITGPDGAVQYLYYALAVAPAELYGPTNQFPRQYTTSYFYDPVRTIALAPPIDGQLQQVTVTDSTLDWTGEQANEKHTVKTVTTLYAGDSMSVDKAMGTVGNLVNVAQYKTMTSSYDTYNAPLLIETAGDPAWNGGVASTKTVISYWRNPSLGLYGPRVASQYHYLNGNTSPNADAWMSNSYYDWGALKTSTSNGSNQHTYSYDATTGELYRSTDALGNIVQSTEYQYGLARTSAVGRLAADGVSLAIEAGTTPAHATYAFDGRVLESTDGRGLKTTYTYNDPLYRITQVQGPGLAPVSTSYSADFLVTTTTVPTTGGGVHRSQSVVNNKGWLTTEYSDAARIEHDYSASGQMTQTRQYLTSDGSGSFTLAQTQNYDALGRVSSVLVPHGSTTYTTSYGYTPQLTETWVTDGRGYTSRTLHEVTGAEASARVSAQISAEGTSEERRVSMLYDPRWGLVKTVQTRKTVNGVETGSEGDISYVYDSAGRLSSQTDKARGTLNYTYYGNGQLANSWDSRGQAASQVTWQYNARGLLTTAVSGTSANGLITRRTLSYDGAGNPLHSEAVAADGSVISVDRVFDLVGNGRMTQETLSVPGQPAYPSTYTYNAGSTRLSPDAVTLPAGLGTIGYTYDAYDRAQTVSANGIPQLTFSYLGQSGLANTLQRSNGLTTTWGYEADASVQTISDNQGIQALTFTRDGNGNPTSITDATASKRSQRRLSYNAQDELSYEQAGMPLAKNAYYKHSYGYDGLGNRISGNSNEVYTYANNRLISATGLPGGENYSYVYDAAGNITAKTVNGLQHTLPRDVFGLQTGYDLEQAYYEKYYYDASGQRVLRLSAGSSPNVFNGKVEGWAGNQPMYELDLKDSQVVGGRFHLNVGGLRYATVESTPGKAAAISFNLINPLGTTSQQVQLVNGTSQVTDMQLDAFGVPIGGATPTSATSFTGKSLDQSSGHWNFGARYYDPKVGRFLGVDPQVSNVNAFIYANNNPLKFVDPDGKKAVIDRYDTYIQVTAFISWYGPGATPENIARATKAGELAWTTTKSWSAVGRGGSGLDRAPMQLLIEGKQMKVRVSILQPNENTPEDEINYIKLTNGPTSDPLGVSYTYYSKNKNGQGSFGQWDVNDLEDLAGHELGHVFSLDDSYYELYGPPEPHGDGSMDMDNRVLATDSPNTLMACKSHYANNAELRAVLNNEGNKVIDHRTGSLRVDQMPVPQREF